MGAYGLVWINVDLLPHVYSMLWATDPRHSNFREIRYNLASYGEDYLQHHNNMFCCSPSKKLLMLPTLLRSSYRVFRVIGYTQLSILVEFIGQRFGHDGNAKRESYC